MITNALYPHRYTSDDRPREVPFAVPTELEILDMATEVCMNRSSALQSSPTLKCKAGPTIELTSEYLDQGSPPSYEEVCDPSPSSSFTLPLDRANSSNKRQKINPVPMMSNAKPLISLTPHNIIDNILRASMMTSPSSMPSPTPSPVSPSPSPFSPLCPSPDSWPALQALLGITNIRPKVVTKTDALIGLDKFIAYVEQQQSVAGILKDVLYEYRRYALQKL